MPIRQDIRSFSTLLQDVSTLHVVSRLQRSKGPTPEELIEQAKRDASRQGHSEGYAAGLGVGRELGLKQGHTEAYSRAYKEATEKCTRELSELFSILATHVAQVNAEIPEWFEQAEDQMTDRTMTILKRLLASELSLGRGHALEIVRECLAEITHSDHIRVRMNPFDSIVVSQHRDELLALAPQLLDIVFVDDPSIEGGCVIESEGGVIDARLDTRLALIEGDLAA
jgi:flagellar biosynthesis/type III secretory pathway protein FliH